MRKKATLIRCVASLLAGSVLTLFLAAGGEACAAQPPFAACYDEFWHEQPPVLPAQEPLYAPIFDSSKIF